MLAQLIREGEGSRGIAERLKRTAAAVRRRTAALRAQSKIPPALNPRRRGPRHRLRRWTGEDIALLAQLLREGKSYEEIAKRTRYSILSIKDQARRLTESER